MDLKQKELFAWENKNFPRHRYEELSKDELISIIYTMQKTLGMAEEVGEVCHHVLKGIQGIREGVNGIDKEQVADGVGDTLIYAEQLLSELDIDAEKELPKVIDQVLQRDWLVNPDGNFEKKEESKTCTCKHNSFEDTYEFFGEKRCVMCCKSLR